MTRGQCTGLPDGIFSNQKSHFGELLEGLAIKDVGIFFGHLVYTTAILYILWSFCIFYGYFFPFWYFLPRKIWQPWQCVSQKFAKDSLFQGLFTQSDRLCRAPYPTHNKT
jgi:hypothetical protein